MHNPLHWLGLDPTSSEDPRVRFGFRLTLAVSLGNTAFVIMMMLAGETGDAWPQVLLISTVQLLLTIPLSFALSNSEHFDIAHLVVAVINYAACGALIVVCGGYPTPMWMTMLFAVYAAAFFIGNAGAFLTAAVALIALLVPHWPSVDTTMLIGSGAHAVTLVVLGIVAASLFRLVSDAEEEQRKVAIQLEGANRSLVDALSQQDSETQQKLVLNEMSDLIQSCANSDEAFSILAGYGSRLFPEHGGAFFVYRNSRDYLELAASWGDLPAERLKTFTSDECWALRRGQPYRTVGSPNEIRCRHLEDGARSSLVGLCVPMMAQGEILGVFHLGPTATALPATDGESTPKATSDETLAITVARNGALGIANLRLRETLRNQALRDPVTQLYNRRYFEEALPREIHRAERRGHPLAVAMLDIDHFKMFNDTYGHEAGDLVLREVGSVLSSSTRGEDLACRYGGEEFVILFVETSLADAIQRAEGMRTHLAAMQVEHAGKTLGKVTISFGVAGMPENCGEDLLKVADKLLYRAKAEGRDRVVAAPLTAQEAT